jgi:hypothetical protein
MLLRQKGMACFEPERIGKEKGEQHSAEVRGAMLSLRERLSASDVVSFEELVSQEPPTGEWVTEWDKKRFGFEAEGVRLEAKELLVCEGGSL